MCYCKHNKRGWNNTHTSGFHAECKRSPSDLCIPIYPEYWKLSGKTAPNHENPGGSSGGGGTLGRDAASQHTSDIIELVQHHQGNSSNYNFTSFLSNFSESIVSLK